MRVWGEPMVEILMPALAGVGVLLAAGVLWVRPWIDDHYSD